ncbi:hypothetical protein BaRGS_00011107, partial [Batillaria attramentaria]
MDVPLQPRYGHEPSKWRGTRPAGKSNNTQPLARLRILTDHYDDLIITLQGAGRHRQMNIVVVPFPSSLWRSS